MRAVLNSMDQLEDRPASAFLDPEATFWGVPSDSAKAFAAVTDVIVERSGRCPATIQSGVLAVGFFLLVLAGAAASVFVFADRVGRMWV